MSTVMVPQRAEQDPPKRSLRIVGYTASDLAYMTGISKSTYDTWRSEGRGPRFVHVEGRKVIYPAASFAAWWDSQEAAK